MSVDNTYINILGVEVPKYVNAYNAHTKEKEDMPTAAVSLEGLQNNALGIAVDGYIGYWDSWKNSFKNAIKEAKPKEIVLTVSSLGGSFQSALEMNDYLAIYCNENDATLKVRYIGMVASAATFIGACSNDIAISKNAFALVHKVSGGAFGFDTDMKKTAEELTKFDNRLAKIYKAIPRNKTSLKSIKAQMEADEFMTADEFVNLGFAHRVFDPAKEPSAYSESDTETDEYSTNNYTNKTNPMSKELGNNTTKNVDEAKKETEVKNTDEVLKKEIADLEAKKEALKNVGKESLEAKRDRLLQENRILTLENEIKDLELENTDLKNKSFTPKVAAEDISGGLNAQNCASCGGGCGGVDADAEANSIIEQIKQDAKATS